MDQLNVEKRGIPTVTIVTVPFEEQARTTAQEQGAPDLSLVLVEHPIAGYDEAGIRAKAEVNLNAILRAATAQQTQ